MKETFIDPLLHPFSLSSLSPQSSSPRTGAPLNDSRNYDKYLRTRPSESLDYLPIASGFLPSVQSIKHEETSETSDDGLDYDFVEGSHFKQSYKSTDPPPVHLTTLSQSGRCGLLPILSLESSFPSCVTYRQNPPNLPLKEQLEHKELRCYRGPRRVPPLNL